MMSVVVSNLLPPENVPGFYNHDVQQHGSSTFTQSFRSMPGVVRALLGGQFLDLDRF
jgi:hypothetical protein